MKTFSRFINESRNIKDLPISNVTILFADIKGSSKLWSENEFNMYDTLVKLESLITRIVNDNKGMVVKTIGDSYMCSYQEEESLLDAIKTAMKIQSDLKKMPIKSGNEAIKLRIGICHGESFIKESKIQGCTLIDYFGNMVGSASRLESEVSNINGFAFSFLEDVDYQEKITSYLKKNNVEIEVIEYDTSCDKNSERKRSSRLLTDLQINSCENINKLKGVKPMIVYKCDLNYD